MRKILWTALLSLVLPLAAWANSSNVVFQNTGGKILVGGTKAHPTLQLSNSILTSFTGLNGITHTGILGTFNFSTGALSSGSLGTSGTFAGGSFTGPVNWVGSYNPSGNHGLGAWTYVLSGSIVGTLSNGALAHGGTVQFTFDVPRGKNFSKSVLLSQGLTTVTVPEPGSLSLLSTGLLTMAGLVRLKFSR